MSASTGNNEFGSNVHVSSHPVMTHKISILRDSGTQPATFRALMREITYHLGYEATSSLTTEPTTIHVNVPKEQEPVECQGFKIRERTAMIPILRSGLGMVDSMLELLPNAAIHHIGMYKVIGHKPVQYFNRLPKKCEVDVAFVLDPVISTSDTINSVVGILKRVSTVLQGMFIIMFLWHEHDELTAGLCAILFYRQWGVSKIHVVSVIGSKAGIEQLIKMYPDISITVGVVDYQVSEAGFVLPGLGDSGDRLFGTHVPLLDDQDDNSTPKRKRTLSVG
jgi:uracil phosphoribosyltransferase